MWPTHRCWFGCSRWPRTIQRPQETTDAGVLVSASPALTSESGLSSVLVSPSSSPSSTEFSSSYPTSSSASSTSASLPSVATDYCDALLTKCQNLPDPYTEGTTGQLFDISCKTDHRRGDFLSISTTTFDSCAKACANFNTHVANMTANSQSNQTMNCVGIAYTPYHKDISNCRLKYKLNDVGTSNCVISALLITS